MEEEKLDPGHSKPRNFLRVLGPIMLIAGGTLSVIGFILFFLPFFTDGDPNFIGMLFLILGGPLVVFSLPVTFMGYMGKIARYQASEIAPVGKDTFNYLVDGTQDSLKTASQAIGTGLGAGIGAGLNSPSSGSQNKIRCHKCNELQDEDAKFCDNCGSAILKTISCPQCNELNDPDAKFCDNCGVKLD